MPKFDFVQILIFLVPIAAMYFFMARSSNKRKKDEESMRNSLKIGDEVVTIGGVMGRIINVQEKSDNIVIESGSEKLRIKKWAVGSIEKGE